MKTTKAFNTNELNSFLHSNKLLCIDVVNLLDGVKELLLKKCKVSNEDVEGEATPLLLMMKKDLCNS